MTRAFTMLLIVSAVIHLDPANGRFYGFSVISRFLTGRRTNYANERTVVIQNNANDSLSLSCSSFSSTVQAEQLSTGGNVTFRFTPRYWFGHTIIWCTLMYRTFWARWDVFNDHIPYLKDHTYDSIYLYTVDEDGIYYKDQKIRSLSSGRNKYVLWDSKTFQTHFLNGFVDEGICNNLPGWIDDSASVAEICGCVFLFDGLHCIGKNTKRNSDNSCVTYELENFKNIVSSIEGC